MPRVLLLALALLSAWSPSRQDQITLEIRVFAGGQEVSGETRITVYRAGDRRAPVAQLTPRTGRLGIPVAPGVYDVQAIPARERGGGHGGRAPCARAAGAPAPPAHAKATRRQRPYCFLTFRGGLTASS